MANIQEKTALYKGSLRLNSRVDALRIAVAQSALRTLWVPCASCSYVYNTTLQQNQVPGFKRKCFEIKQPCIHIMAWLLANLRPPRA